MAVLLPFLELIDQSLDMSLDGIALRRVAPIVRHIADRRSSWAVLDGIVDHVGDRD